MMNKTVTLKTTGIDLIDNKWGGFYNGSTYIVNGPSKSGRTTLALQYAYNAALQGEVTLYFTEIRPRKLIVAAHAQGMEIQPLIDENKLIILRTAPLRMEENGQDRDSLLSEFLYDLLNAVNEFNPSNIIFDELTPYMDFNDKDLFVDVFTEIIESLEDMLITSIFIIQDQSDSDNASLQKQLQNIATGNIQLDKRISNSNVTKPNNRMRVVSDFDRCDQATYFPNNYDETASTSINQEIKIASVA
ncbi:MAG: RAD55 family ATPase [Candidatus Zhuqueibacterota bacterium]